MTSKERCNLSICIPASQSRSLWPRQDCPAIPSAPWSTGTSNLSWEGSASGQAGWKNFLTYLISGFRCGLRMLMQRWKLKPEALCATWQPEACSALGMAVRRQEHHLTASKTSRKARDGARFWVPKMSLFHRGENTTTGNKPLNLATKIYIWVCSNFMPLLNALLSNRSLKSLWKKPSPDFLNIWIFLLPWGWGV